MFRRLIPTLHRNLEFEVAKNSFCSLSLMMPKSLPRVLVVDDHKLVLDSIDMLAETHNSFEVVGHALDGLEAVHQYAALKPDIILMDIHMPNMSGLEATQLIMQNGAKTNIIALTMTSDGDQYMFEMMGFGAKGYILKSSGMDEILIAIDMVMAGHRYISHSLIPTLIDVVIRRTDPESRSQERTPSLSRRELEVLRLISSGLANQTIGDRLAISARTVENHRHTIMAKAGVKSMPALVDYAKGKGWI
jgi:DNA-binding NarL/FixJ family response regulator